jgi:hypothetical protein
MIRKIALVLMVCSTLAGCGHISVHKQEDLSDREVGIKYYAPKPYILVARTGAKDAPVSVEQIYLPDLAHPYYAKMSAGIGSSKLSLGFANGVLTSLGQETDPGISGLVTALAGVPGSLATAAKTRAETAALHAQASDEDIAKASRYVASAATTIQQQLAAPNPDRLATPAQLGDLGRIQKALDSESKQLLQPGSTARLPQILDGMKATKKDLASTREGAREVPAAAKVFWSNIAAAEGDLSKAIALIAPKEEEPMSFTLYEVIMTEGGTTLHEVPFPDPKDK